MLAEPANAELDAAVAAAEKEAADLEARLKRASQAPPVKPRDMVRAVKKHNEHRGLWLKRKRAFKEVVEVIAENMDLHPKKFIAAVADAQDVETDEDAGAQLPPPPPSLCPRSSRFPITPRPHERPHCRARSPHYAH